VVTFALVVWVLVAAVWAAIAGNVLHATIVLVLALQFFMGLCGALISMSNVRLAMAIVPAMGRNHFFALYSVIGSLTLGIGPILWGLGIDAIGARHSSSAHFTWNRFSTFFVAVAFVFLIAIVFARRLDEPRAKSMDALLRDLFVHTPQRVWARVWPRF
jgi:MFS family permease